MRLVRVQKNTLALLGAILASFPVAVRANDRCGTYPDIVYEQATYAGWSDCVLKSSGERPLWNQLPQRGALVMRFVFTEGHASFFRAITITQAPDGRARLKVSGAGRPGVKAGLGKHIRTRTTVLSADDWTGIQALAADAGVWNFEVGSWDGDEIYMHCQLLEMELADADAYRYSSVNVGCNHPPVLMPLVNEIARLAGLKAENDGRLFH